MKTFQGLIIWFIITLFVSYVFCLNTASAVFASVIKTSLHASDMNATLATSAFIAGFACMQIPAGYLLDNYHPKWVVSAGILILTLGNVSISLSDNIVLFSISNFFQGIGGSFAFIGAGVLIAQWFRPAMFPILFGLTQTISCFSVGIMHFLFVYLLKTMSWATLYQYLAMFGTVLLVLSLLFITRPAAESKDKSLSFLTSIKSVCGNSQIWLCTIAGATSFGILMSYAGFWYLKVQNFYNLSESDSLLISALIFAGIGIGTPLLGYLSNLVKSRMMVIHTSLALGGICLLVAIYFPHFNQGTLGFIYVISFLTGFFLSGAELFYTVISEMTNNQIRGVALSFANTGIFILNTLMMFMPYYFVTATSATFFTYLWILPLGVMISIMLVYFIKETYQS